MNTTFIRYRYLWILSLFFLVGCNTTAPEATSTRADIPALRTQTAATVIVNVTQTIAAIHPTASPTLQPSASPTKPFTLEDLRLLLTKNRNMQIYASKDGIYLNDGLNPPKQLTRNSQDRDPILSDDGKKIVFYRGKANNDDNDNVYSINVDGSQEKQIISSKSLPLLGRGNVRSLIFLPKTHSLLFNTYLCSPSQGGPSYDAPDCTVGIYRVDADTGKIEPFLQGLSGNTMQSYRGNFAVSPNGRYTSVTSSGHIDLYDDGTVYPDVIRYYRTQPDEYLPHQFWLPDSSGLVAVVSTDTGNEPGTPPFTYGAWRYTAKDKLAVQVNFPAVMMSNSGCSFSVSPDRNWILFLGNETGDITADLALYLGNLIDGSMKTIDWKLAGDCPTPTSTRWSSDSQHYAFYKAILNLDGTQTQTNGSFKSWIDSTHYYYTIKADDPTPQKTYAAELGGVSVLVPEDFDQTP